MRNLLADANRPLDHVDFQAPAESAADKPAALAATACAAPMICVPVQTSQRSGRTCTVQFTGSIGACARNGNS
jgi:phosphoribosylcarboxyaminoimidazole (NCAIR) mutase